MGSDRAKSTVVDDEDEFAWARQYTMPEEYIITHCHPMARNNYYRWFASPNIIDLVRIRRQQQKQLNRTISRKP
jgi:hypothetical protein